MKLIRNVKPLKTSSWRSYARRNFPLKIKVVRRRIKFEKKYERMIAYQNNFKILNGTCDIVYE